MTVTIDNFTIILATATVVTAAVSPFLNVMTRRLEHCGDDDPTGEDNSSVGGGTANAEAWPGVSVVITVDDDAEGLKQTLAAVLRQDYPGEMQVVVVLAGGDGLAEDALKPYAADKRIYTTFIPSSSRYVSRRKLAVTMGVKAARHQWIMLTDTGCAPHSDRWIRDMAECCRQGSGIVAGITELGGEASAAHRFDHAYTLYRQMADAQRGRAWGYCGNNLLFRKDMFLGGKGFDGNLKYIRGEYDFIVNKFAATHGIALNTGNGAGVTRPVRSQKEWRGAYLSYMAVRKHLDRSKAPRRRANATTAVMAAAYTALLAAVAAAGFMQRWVELAVAAAALVAAVILRGYVLRRSVGRMAGITATAKLAWLELTLPLRNLARMVRYRRADKLEFICHKI